MDKKIIIYCSCFTHLRPPFSWYNAAQKLSEKIPVIYIDNLKLRHEKVTLDLFLHSIKWWVIKFLRPWKFIVWDLNLSFSKYILFGYLFYKKYILNYKIILITNIPDKRPVYDFIPYSTSYYECTDQYYKDQFIRNSKRIKLFNLVFTNTGLLEQEMRKITTNVVRISSGYSESLLINTNLKNKKMFKIPKSMVFSGTISKRIDFELVAKLANIASDYNIFLIGDLVFERGDSENKIYRKEWNNLLKLSNVKHLGSFSNEQVANLLPLFEFGIIPYSADNLFNHYSHPVKLYEYLASGLNVISTAIPSILEYNKLSNLNIASTAEEFNTIIRNRSSSRMTDKDIIEINIVLNKQNVKRKISQILSKIT